MDSVTAQRVAIDEVDVSAVSHGVRAAETGETAMQRVRRLVQRVACGTISVLLLGETGVGKERMAEAVHRASPRARRPFLCLNCAALSESLLESELFGHEKGAFTSASGAKPGLLETADGGTVFLDEVGELSRAMQVKLLRVLEDRKVMRVGSVTPRAIDVRFVSATNRDLRAEIASGQFREDLFFRLNGVSVRIPPLRERRTELRALARELALSLGAAGHPHVSPQISERAFVVLEAHAWPGNIRELRNAIERAALVAEGGSIEPEHLELEVGHRTLPSPPEAALAPPSGAPVIATGGGDHRQQLVYALAQTAGNQTQAARLLGISRATLVRRLDEYGLPRPRRAAR